MGHAPRVFVILKMLHPYFLHHRELLGALSRAGWETVLELMCEKGAWHHFLETEVSLKKVSTFLQSHFTKQA